MPYDIILFDLDGTLTDSAEGIINSVIYALERKGVPCADKQELRRFVGPPLQESFSKYFGFSEDQAKDAVRIFRLRETAAMLPKVPTAVWVWPLGKL